MNKEQVRMNMEVVAVKEEETTSKGFTKGAKGIVKQIDKNGLLIEFKSGLFRTKEGGSTYWWVKYDQVEPVKCSNVSHTTLVKHVNSLGISALKARYRHVRNYHFKDRDEKFWCKFEERLMRKLANGHYGHDSHTCMMTDSIPYEGIKDKDKDKAKVDGLEMNWDEIIAIIEDEFHSVSKKMLELEKSLEYNVKQYVDHDKGVRKVIHDLTDKLQKIRKEREKVDRLYSKVQRFSTIHHALNVETFTSEEKAFIVKLVGQFIISTSRDLVKFVLLYGGE